MNGRRHASVLERQWLNENERMRGRLVRNPDVR